MILLLIAFIAGVLTVLAPCVLPLLPVIIGGSVSGNTSDKKRPAIIVASLAISLITFTLLLKATALFINVPPQFITITSGVIIVVLGMLLLFPQTYARIIARLGIEAKSQQLLGAGFKNKSQFIGPIVIGAALGPVFSSCSPVYGYILATVLPVNFGQAIIYMLAYIAGLSSVLLLIGYVGQRFIAKLKWASDPKGAFTRIMAILFIIVGLLVATGYDKRVQVWLANHTPFDFDGLTSQLIPGSSKDNGEVFNVEPYAAPEFVGLENWINSDPQTLEKLKGKVVLVDFWTYSCINCIRSVPYVQKWYDAYKDDGLVVVGVHAPEFAFERLPQNVQKAVKDNKLTYPVALDNGFTTWGAFKNQYWPAHYLIDKDGKVRRQHFGEGEYAKTEQAIRTLLEERGANLSGRPLTASDTTTAVNSGQTPETYLGVRRASNYVGSPALGAQPTNTFTPVQSLKENQWTLGGTWEVTQEKIIARGDSTLSFMFKAKEMYVVASAADIQKIQVTLNDKPITDTGNAGSDIMGSMVAVKDAKLYRLVRFPAPQSGTLQLHVPDGVELNVFTFGN